VLFLKHIGKPILNWTRITVEWVVRKILDRVSIQDILDAYPHLNREQVAAALDYDDDMMRPANFSNQ
jgi:uncharacterized protein (DUF433 family)